MIHAITQKIQRMITPVVLAASIALPLKAKANSMELFVADKNTTTDIRMAGELAPHINVYLRTITSVDYNNQVSYFGLADLSYNLHGGLDAVLETQATSEEGIIPRPGVQYFKQMGNVSLFALGTVSLKNEKNVESVTEIEYNPSLHLRWNLLSHLENIANIGEHGHNFSIQKLRIGVGTGRYSVGAGADISEAQGDISYVIGGFLKVTL